MPNSKTVKYEGGYYSYNTDTKQIEKIETVRIPVGLEECPLELIVLLKDMLDKDKVCQKQ